ncbi:glutathione S-transferase family protein [Azoarcus olearius]|uniref:Probable glutathione transferase n=1 Tax=Azoarcus sp. (strain BH72) TaxID=418699 RepID=A1K1M6_AZOSB|nr:glutathione S-transferase [Azoarcus olearius]CAL92731.1 probable glutathione transferase [Azoarcus olearius]
MTRSIPQGELVLYGLPLSGHCHRVALFLSLLRLPYRYENVDLAGGAHRRPDFLALNPFGQIPVLKDGEQVIADSNAILVYLARRYGGGEEIEWLPDEPVAAAEVQRWFSAAAGLLAFGPARARLKHVFGAPIDYDAAVELANRLLPVMEAELARRPYLAADAPTLADIALYSYTAHAPEGGISLQPYPHIRAWLARVEALPGFVGMPRSALPAGA